MVLVFLVQVLYSHKVQDKLVLYADRIFVCHNLCPRLQPGIATLLENIFSDGIRNLKASLRAASGLYTIPSFDFAPAAPHTARIVVKYHAVGRHTNTLAVHKYTTIKGIGCKRSLQVRCPQAVFFCRSQLATTIAMSRNATIAEMTHTRLTSQKPGTRAGLAQDPSNTRWL